jgi:hypothetical protein
MSLKYDINMAMNCLGKRDLEGSDRAVFATNIHMEGLKKTT